jgi:ATP-dependent exoDNAse (exonuclease V) beta subunit
VRGRRGTSLQAFIDATIAAAQLDAIDARRMTQLVAQVEGSAEFAALIAGNAAAPELSVMQVLEGDGQLTVTEGVIDVAVDGADGWLVVDWKSDSVGAEGWARALEQYTAQVNRYAAMLTGITGAPAAGRVVRVGQS